MLLNGPLRVEEEGWSGKKGKRQSLKLKMRPPSPSLPEKQFLLEAISQSLRLDGRSLLEQRPPKLSFGPELGWVECALGKTRFALRLIAFDRN